MGWLVSAVCAVIAVVGLFLFWKFWFLRQPLRLIPPDGIVSPAHGKLVKIIEFNNGTAVNVPKGLLGGIRTLTRDVAEDGYVLVIMMTPMDIHYQRGPVSGKILKVNYTPGKFKNAVAGADKLQAFENEKNEILIQAGKEKYKVVQVAGALARRISCSVKKNDSILKGQTIGLINLGSQVLLVIPEKNLLVEEGQRMIDGETVIAK